MLASGMVIEGGQVIDRILSGMDWIISKGARILSMSLGLRGFTPAFQAIVDALRTHNVLPIIAVGNEGPGTSRSPGNYINVVSIGAMSDQDIVADFSGSQTFIRTEDPLVPNLVAPGVGVISCAPKKTYVSMDGSSMATPHVAGLAALLLQAKPGATADEVEKAILAACRLPTDMLKERGNLGVPDAVVAFTTLTGGAPVALPGGSAPTLGVARRRAAAGRKRAAAPGRRSRPARSKAKKARSARRSSAGKTRRKR
jgi:subtilisin family serine protease